MWCAAYSHNVPQLPFELQVLELALGDICQMCSNLGKDLDGVAFPALDELMKHVGSSALTLISNVLVPSSLCCNFSSSV